MRNLIYFFICIFMIGTACAEFSLEITEIYPNPIGKDKGNESEFIEIHNFGNLSIRLKGIRLKNNSNKTIELSDFYTEIKPYEYLVFYPSFNLRNTNEKIKLLFGADIIDQFKYNATIEGMSWIKIEKEWYVGKQSGSKPNFKNISIFEYKINCSNNNFIKAETLLNNNKENFKGVYISKNFKNKRLGLYFLILSLIFVSIVFITEKWKARK